MKLLFLMLLTIQNSYAYKAEDINLNDYEYNRYIKPQLINISQDFVTLHTIINPEITPYKSVFYKFKELIKLLTNSVDRCNTQKTDSCEINIKLAKNLTKSILETLDTPPDFSKKNQFEIEDSLKVSNNFLVLKNQIYSFYISLDQYYFFKASNSKGPKNLEELITKSEELYNHFYNFIHISSDKRFRNEFISFWNDFYKVVNFHILTTNNKDMFIRKVNDLNLILNVLNITLTKRNHEISKQTQTLLKIMHNRWNNVLKVTLRK